MAKRLCIILLFLLLPAVAWGVPSFPGAEGHGASAIGCAGPTRGTTTTKICHVISTSGGTTGSTCARDNCGDNCWCGTFRYCMGVGNSTCTVFETSGVIQTSSNIDVNNSYQTIAGETAPAPGVAFRQASLRIFGDHVIVRHIGVWAGTEGTTPSINSRDSCRIEHTASDVILDHVACIWGTDENFSVCNGNICSATPQRMTFQYGMAAEGLTGGNGSRGSLIQDGVETLSIHHSLYSNNNERNVRFRGAEIEFINNVVYNWGPGAGVTFEGSDATTAASLDLIKNYYKAGPNSTTSTYVLKCGGSSTPVSGTQFYVANNICPDRPADTGNSWNCVNGCTQAGAFGADDPVIASAGEKEVTQHDVVDNYEDMILAANAQNVGPRPFDRKAGSYQPETRILLQVEEDEGNIRQCVTGCADAAESAWPTRAVNTNPFSIPANKDTLSGDYTIIENLLHVYAAAVTVGPEGGEDPAPPPQPGGSSPSPSVYGASRAIGRNVGRILRH